jgi:hypothetical protein
VILALEASEFKSNREPGFCARASLLSGHADGWFLQIKLC